MSQRNNPRDAGRLLAIAVVALSAVTLTACREDFLDRRDTVSLGVGEANAHNKAIQTRDPWPAVANSSHSTTRGDQVQKVQDEFIKRDRFDPARSTGQSQVKQQ